MKSIFYTEVSCVQRNHDGERICGDVFLSKKLKEEGRIISVLSDGMGHGVKANVLATLTATMALNLSREHRSISDIADIIMKTLPVCSDRKISYSTFTIIDVEFNGKAHIIEFDNPQAIILRGTQKLDLKWESIEVNSEKNKGKILRLCSFHPEKEDRIIFFSDGITQSGLGNKGYPFGWGLENVIPYALRMVQAKTNISAHKLANKILNAAFQNDNYTPKDDLSCAVTYFREPRKLMVCTGPPYHQENDAKLAQAFDEFKGRKIICGATTGDIISRELNKKIIDSFEFYDPDLPPMSSMDGADLITEGILTLEKVHSMLKRFNSKTNLGKGPADSIVKLMLRSDEIHFIIGTRVNVAHQDPNLPVELEIRRTVVHRIARELENLFLKETSINYI